MTKKKRSQPTVEEVLERPWCYYCERDFDDLKILLNHQKAKHFKCDRCGRRLNTAGGLSVHMNQVHKENLESVENALPNRSGLNVEIFGMEGIPEDIVQQHNQRVIQQYHQDQADRRAQTGNPTPGSGEGSANKKPRLESGVDLKARLAAFKAKKAAGEAGTQSNGNGSPAQAQSPGMAPSPAPFQAGVPGYGAPQYPPQGSPPAQFQQSYTQPGFQQNAPPFPPQSPFQQGPPGYQQQQAPPGMQQYPPLNQQPPPFNAASPPPGMFNPRQTGSPAQGPMFNRPPGLSPAPGLPSRPTVQAPAVNPQQFQQMHQGQYSSQAPPTQDPRQRPPPAATSTMQATEAGVDAMVSEAAQNTSEAATVPTTDAPPAATEKKGKKDKEKATKLVYNDNDVSPEEKMAAMSRYAFDPSKEPEETIVGTIPDGSGAGVTGVVTGPDDVVDNQGD